MNPPSGPGGGGSSNAIGDSPHPAEGDGQSDASDESTEQQADTGLEVTGTIGPAGSGTSQEVAGGVLIDNVDDGNGSKSKWAGLAVGSAVIVGMGVAAILRFRAKEDL